MFFFFKQKTAYEVRISDWSSDVCSSDLLPMASVLPLGRIERRTRHRDGRLRLGQGIAKTHTIDGEEQLAFADHLIVPDMHLLNPAGHIGRQRHYVGAYLSVPGLRRIGIVGVEMPEHERGKGGGEDGQYRLEKAE